MTKTFCDFCDQVIPLRPIRIEVRVGPPTQEDFEVKDCCERCVAKLSPVIQPLRSDGHFDELRKLTRT